MDAAGVPMDNITCCLSRTRKGRDGVWMVCYGMVHGVDGIGSSVQTIANWINSVR